MKSWTEKLNNSKGLPKVVKIKPNQVKRWGKGTIAIPSPLEVDELINKIPRGKVATINTLRKMIAKKHKATIGCPITTGIFANIAAHAAIESGSKTPWWRVLKGKGELNPKYPPGQRELLKKEGHELVRKNNKLFVKGYEEKLYNPN